MQLERLFQDFLKFFRKFLKTEKTAFPKAGFLPQKGRKPANKRKFPVFSQAVTPVPIPPKVRGKANLKKDSGEIIGLRLPEKPLPETGFFQKKAKTRLTSLNPTIGRRTLARTEQPGLGLLVSAPTLAVSPRNRATPGTTSSLDDTKLPPSAKNVDSPQRPTVIRKKVVGKILIPAAAGVMSRVLGPRGDHVKSIALRHGAKLRIRGIGSGHLEGRTRTECQAPLHMCISCPSQQDFDKAFQDCKKLIERVTKDTTQPIVKSEIRKLRLAVVNEGKLSESASFFLSSWAKDNLVSACLVSEGALPGRTLATEGGYCWAAPLVQRKGGAALLFSPEAVAWERKVKLSQCPQRGWAIAAWSTPSGTGVVSVYINPIVIQDPEIRDIFLDKLSIVIGPFPRCIIAGDFNSATNTASRRSIDRWSADNGFRLINKGVLSHFFQEGHPGSDLDLIFARGVNVSLLENTEPFAKGHIRQLFELEERPSKPRIRELQPNWKKLACPNTQKQFKESVKSALETLPSLDEALAHTATAMLDVNSSSGNCSRPLPGDVRRVVRRLRQNARKVPRGSKEHREISQAIGNTIRRHRRENWRVTLKKLASSKVVEADTWKLLKHLQKTTPTANMVGIPDEEIQETYSSIYQSNTVRRSDWNSAPSLHEIASGGQYDKLDQAFTTEEVIATLKSLPNRKAAGLDGIPHEAYKTLVNDVDLIERIRHDANEYFFGQTIPELKARLVVIPKKGAPESASQMRPLMMLPTSRKILEKLIANRLNCLADERGWDGMCPLQSGFRRGLSLERQLVFVQVAILDARSKNTSLRAVALDLVKAFDRVPKQFAAHCAAGYLKPLCPRLADLVVRLTLAPMSAEVGDTSFEVATGVAQGGILSPWLFIMVMNDLALRLSGGGYEVDGTNLGTPLLADDILLLDPNSDSSETRCQLTQEWVEEWGGEINSQKTQWIDINTKASPTPFDTQSSTICRGRTIDYLGVIITTTGIKPKINADEFLKTWKAIRSTMSVRGLSPGASLQVLRTLAYGRVSHGVVVTLPCAAELTNNWLRAARQILCTYEQVHRWEVQRELGLLYHPIAWLCWSIIQFYGTVLSTKRDPVLKRVLLETVASPNHQLRQKIEQALLPSGITWDELVSTPVVDLKRKADARIQLWMREQLMEEGKRLNIKCNPISNTGPRKYLFEENGRYGFAFRTHSLGPADLQVGCCYFCGAANGNCGSHILHCEVARTVVPLSKALCELLPDELRDALLLEDSLPKDRLRLSLEYMKRLWKENAERHKRNPGAKLRHNYTHNTQLFKAKSSFEHRALSKINGNRRRSRVSIDKMKDGRMRSAKRCRTSTAATPAPIIYSPVPAAEQPADSDSLVNIRLTLIDDACHDFPPSPSDDPEIIPISQLASTKRQRDTEKPAVSFITTERSNEVAKRVRLDLGVPSDADSIIDAVVLPPYPEPIAQSKPFTSDTPATIQTGPWTMEENIRLAEGVLDIGPARPTELARRVQTRDVTGIKSRVGTLGFKRFLKKFQEGKITATQRSSDPSVPSMPEATHTGKWSRDELSRLAEALRVHGEDAPRELLAKCVRTRTRTQVYDRLKTIDLEANDSGLNYGRWTETEVALLEESINELGTAAQHTEIAAIVCSRTPAQVATKLQELTKTGMLSATGPSAFTIKR